VGFPVVKQYLEQAEAIVQTITHDQSPTSTSIHKWRPLTTPVSC